MHEQLELLHDKLAAVNCRLQLVMEYGSQAFNLDNETSDNDYMVVFSQEPDNYLGLKESNRILSTLTDGDMTFQFMDLKRFFSLAQQSNFTLYVGLQNVVWNSFEVAQLPSPYQFSMRKLAHHCLGLVDNKSQRQYMKAYSSLFVMFLMQNGNLPSVLDYNFLLDNVDSVPNVVKELLNDKKNGKKFSTLEVSKPFTHEQVNVLPEATLDYNDAWLYWLKESME